MSRKVNWIICIHFHLNLFHNYWLFDVYEKWYWYNINKIDLIGFLGSFFIPFLAPDYRPLFQLIGPANLYHLLLIWMVLPFPLLIDNYYLEALNGIQWFGQITKMLILDQLVPLFRLWLPDPEFEPLKIVGSRFEIFAKLSN